MLTSPSRINAIWKGKAKATEADFDDLNPVITYRHLLSQTPGVSHPLRVIALCDSDAFYAACEQVRLGIDPAKPLVVQQWDMLIAVNYPARKYGISRMDKARDAKEKCPDLICVHVATYKEGAKEPGYWPNPDTRTHKVSLDHYRRESMKVAAMFKEGVPEGEVEKASIDEAFIDFTLPVRNMMLDRYPYLARVPPDAPHGLDSRLPPPPPIDWSGKGVVVPIKPVDDEKTDDDDQNSDEDYDDCDAATTWHDVALSLAAELMQKIREDIHTKLGYTTSAGIARNKFLAKLAASYRKPMSQTILRNSAIPNYLRPMKFQKVSIRNLGGKLGEALAQEFDATTVGDLLNVSLADVMQRKFGEESLWVYEILRYNTRFGIDRSEVKEKSIVNKSMLASKNLATPVAKPSEGHHWIRVLAAELALRLNEARESRPGLWPKTLVLHVRQGYAQSRSKQGPFPFTRNLTIDVIAAAGDKLWKELVGTGDSPRVKITAVQLAFTGVETMEDGQRNIEGFFGGADNTAPSDPNTQDTLDPSDTGDNSCALQSSFTCERCGKRIALPADLLGLEDEDLRRDALAALRIEHDDFHFAEELAKPKIKPNRGVVPPTSKARGKNTAKTKSKIAKEQEGIAKFFTRQ
ncbi:DNA/RNA polymerase [Punctularia strigosozonata HHB-11173 SS5]|uniref:DNA/RNA polymerase n=1 Tax=Punctularia strigosozonata (strain HHB-11173) TaxID=741275 RepID=UPI0004416642|nr:DNA/RNA polymerase [Punctularia strigosozonata HHB-11173 SS5]EIN09832.1 DNA/RNA polymerase [Punctularia strigosozonata HHB-11173 SS5]